MNVEIGAEAAQFPEKEYISGIAVAVCYIRLQSAFIIFLKIPSGLCPLDQAPKL
jgi:hypothetical protein